MAIFLNDRICKEKTEGNIRQNYGIYWANTMGYIGLKLKVVLWYIFEKPTGYIWKKIGIYWAKTKGYIGLRPQCILWDLLG